MKPIVAIIGRPNVGKSTFFNRITRGRHALVDDHPGVTRDRNYGDAVWEGVDFTLVDTGGYSDGGKDTISRQVRFQLFQAIEESDVIVHMLDGKAGLSPFDTDLIQRLREVEKPIFYVVNKIDGAEKEENLYEFYQLGIETLFPVSAVHGYGVHDFLDSLVGSFPLREASGASDTTKVAVVGRPNVGKSSLINAIIGQQRLLVSHIPGTTRDSVDTVFQLKGVSYLFIDTAGIRRKGRVKQKIEKFSVVQALKSLERCDVALILLDASAGVTDQDLTVAGHALDRGCGCILLINKWDLVGGGTRTVKQATDEIRSLAKFLNFAPVLTISAKTGLRVKKIFRHIDTVYQQYTARIGTGRLNQIIEEATRKAQPPLSKGRTVKLFYGTQVAAKPPTFICFANHPEAVHFSYRRYLINQIRRETGLDHTPIRLYFRNRPKR